GLRREAGPDERVPDADALVDRVRPRGLLRLLLRPGGGLRRGGLRRDGLLLGRRLVVRRGELVDELRERRRARGRLARGRLRSGLPRLLARLGIHRVRRILALRPDERGAVVVGVEDDARGKRRRPLGRARLHLEDLLAEEAADPTDDAVALTRDHRVGTELLGDPGQQLLERLAAVGLRVGVAV